MKSGSLVIGVTALVAARTKQLLLAMIAGVALYALLQAILPRLRARKA